MTDTVSDSRLEALGTRPAASLSASRAGDFMTCPLLYRFRAIDRLPEQPGVDAVRGTLVHAVLERLFDHAPADRTLPNAQALLPGQWQQLLDTEPELRVLLFGPDDAWQRHQAGEDPGEPDPAAEQRFLAEATALVARYFELEDPTRLNPAEREYGVSVPLASGLTLRGIIDRLDRAPSGALRVVDYKTGRAPGDGWEHKALFQMRFYGLMLWRSLGVIPARLQLLYLGSGEVLHIEPTEVQLRATEAKVEALWAAIDRATANGHWPAKSSKLCGWCSFQQFCPEFGGTPPTAPAAAPATDPTATPATAAWATPAAAATKPTSAAATQPTATPAEAATQPTATSAPDHEH